MSKEFTHRDFLQGGEMAPGDIPVLVVDHFVAKPGEGKAFLEYFLTNYQTMAEAAGLTLKRTLVSPPVWFTDMSNTIEVVWEMQGGNAFWGIYTAATRQDPRSIEFWRDIKSCVEYHDRMYLGDAEGLEAMNNV